MTVRLRHGVGRRRRSPDFASQHWNPPLSVHTDDVYIYKFENFVRQIFLNSDTSIALLGGAPFDDRLWEFLANDQMREAANMVNRVAGGSTRILAHSVITPGQPGWLDKVDYGSHPHRAAPRASPAGHGP